MQSRPPGPSPGGSEKNFLGPLAARRALAELEINVLKNKQTMKEKVEFSHEFVLKFVLSFENS